MIIQLYCLRWQEERKDLTAKSKGLFSPVLFAEPVMVNLSISLKQMSHVMNKQSFDTKGKCFVRARVLLMC